MLMATFSLTKGVNPEKLYLKNNKSDLHSTDFNPAEEIRIVGFGAVHGSAKTEITEIKLLKDLIKHNRLKYYFPETDFSTAYFFNEYISSGDTNLLKSLIYEYGERIPQERTIEVYEKWKTLRVLFRKNHIQVIGIDKPASYKFSVLHLVRLLHPDQTNHYLDSLNQLTNTSENWSAFGNSSLQKMLKRFVAYVENNKTVYNELVSDTGAFYHILRNIKSTFSYSSREAEMLNNYREISPTLEHKNKIQFFRMGVFHILKNRINGGSPLFHRIAQNELYKTNQILTIQGFLANSRVLWDVRKDENGKFLKYTTKGRFGISDHFLEHFKGIKYLKRNTLSDLTLFHLTQTGSPFIMNHNGHLIKIKRLLRPSLWKPENKMATAHYFDVAILIRDSEASRPLEILN